MFFEKHQTPIQHNKWPLAKRWHENSIASSAYMTATHSLQAPADRRTRGLEAFPPCICCTSFPHKGARALLPLVCPEEKMAVTSLSSAKSWSWSPWLAPMVFFSASWQPSLACRLQKRKAHSIHILSFLTLNQIRSVLVVRLYMPLAQI